MLFPIVVHAQAISLSVSPPILEVMIAPGKSVEQNIIISSLESEVNLTPKIVSFIPNGDFGEGTEVTNSPPPWVTLNTQSVKITPGGTAQVSLKIAPPEGSPERDYYLTVMFESQEEPNTSDGNISAVRARIASNLLITISKNGLPAKKAEITEFKAPKFIDSFFPIKYGIKIANVGNTFFKPIGKIIVSPTFGKENSIPISPLNVLSGYQRSIFCLNGENLTDCKLGDKFLFGVYKSNLEFGLDDGPVIYKSQSVTYAFPFIGMVLVIFPIYIVSRLVIHFRK